MHLVKLKSDLKIRLKVFLYFQPFSYYAVCLGAVLNKTIARFLDRAERLYK